MRRSDQDRVYLETEGDAFFERNFSGVDPHVLRERKRGIAERIARAGVTPRRVLEFGCNYGDLVHHYASTTGAEAVGVEASAAAVAFGRASYGDDVRLEHGTLADNPINADPSQHGRFDLIVVDDVFCWVSRETLLQSLANCDELLAEGGYLFVREFLPAANTRNRNHHVADQDVWCFKPAATHAGVLVATGIYAEVWRAVEMDDADPWARDRAGRPFESRWIDSVLRKSYRDFYAT